MVNSAVYDAWKVKPPCMYESPFCHSRCPYYVECIVNEDGDDNCDE